MALRREWKCKGISVTYAAPRAARTDAAAAFAALIAKTTMTTDRTAFCAHDIRQMGRSQLSVHVRMHP